MIASKLSFLVVAALLGLGDAAAAQAGDEEPATGSPPGEVPGAAAAAPQEVPPESEAETAIEVHAFVSQGLLWSSANNYLARSARGSAEFIEVGINFHKRLSQTLRTGLQLFTRDLGPLGNYTARFDWAFLDWRPADWFGLRAGRYKIPFGLQNEFSDYDAGRVSILLPQPIYPLTQREFLLAATGANLYGYLVLEEAGALEYHLYGGTIFIDPSDLGVANASFEVPYAAGARLLWETPVTGLRVGGSILATRLDFTVPVQTTPVSGRLPAFLWVASADYRKDALLLAAEYSRWDIETRRSTDPTRVPENRALSERFYVLAAWRFSGLVQPGFYYAALFPEAGERGGSRENYQHDFAASLRLDLHRHWLLKLEAHYLRGTAYLSPALNDGTPRASLTRDWVLLLAKTTLFF